MIRTSYIANLSKVESDFDYIYFIVSSIPKTLKIKPKYIWKPILAPTSNISYKYKIGNINYIEFERRYIEYLKSIPSEHIRQIIQKHNDNKSILIVTYEKDYSKCHRGIFASILSKIIQNDVMEL